MRYDAQSLHKPGSPADPTGLPGQQCLICQHTVAAVVSDHIGKIVFIFEQPEAVFHLPFYADTARRLAETGGEGNK